MRAGSLFTGYGGLDEAVKAVFGSELAWVADNDGPSATVLAHRYPDVPNLGDITTINWSEMGGDARGSLADVDIVSGGFP